MVVEEDIRIQKDNIKIMEKILRGENALNRVPSYAMLNDLSKEMDDSINSYSRINEVSIEITLYEYDISFDIDGQEYFGMERLKLKDPNRDEELKPGFFTSLYILEYVQYILTEDDIQELKELKELRKKWREEVLGEEGPEDIFKDVKNFMIKVEERLAKYAKTSNYAPYIAILFGALAIGAGLYVSSSFADQKSVKPFTEAVPDIVENVSISGNLNATTVNEVIPENAIIEVPANLTGNITTVDNYTPVPLRVVNEITTLQTEPTSTISEELSSQFISQIQNIEPVTQFISFEDNIIGGISNITDIIKSFGEVTPETNQYQLIAIKRSVDNTLVSDNVIIDNNRIIRFNQTIINEQARRYENQIDLELSSELPDYIFEPRDNKIFEYQGDLYSMEDGFTNKIGPINSSDAKEISDLMKNYQDLLSERFWELRDGREFVSMLRHKNTRKNFMREHNIVI